MRACCSIGYAIAQRLVKDGAMVMVSSRKEGNVTSAVERLREGEGEGDVAAVQGIVCHVGKEEHRKRLLEEVWLLPPSFPYGECIPPPPPPPPGRQCVCLVVWIYWCPMQLSIPSLGRQLP